jgi:DNA-directed RNA polymerase specialized sigma24 family protein
MAVNPSSPKKDWVLTQDAFDRLLTRLDRDVQRAGQRYEDIRRALITFFENRGSHAPEDLADQTINRVARRLVEGREIYADNPASYFYGVARNVLKEQWQPAVVLATLDAVPASRLAAPPGQRNGGDAEPEHRERRLECLDDCLHAIASKDAELIRAYYQGETAVKIGNRKMLAERLGIGATALRIRALRIREKLERCVDRCLDGGQAG